MPTSNPNRPNASFAAKVAAVNEALYVKNGAGRYLTTEHSCKCPDHQYRGRVCKHMRAFRTLFCENAGDEPAPEQPDDESGLASGTFCQVCGLPWCNGDHSNG